LFEDERQERDFVVRGGLLWFHHVLVAAVEVDKSFQVRTPLSLFLEEDRDFCLGEELIIVTPLLPRSRFIRN
jgi:hypothetical protein